jgi:hypothetical protein
VNCFLSCSQFLLLELVIESQGQGQEQQQLEDRLFEQQEDLCELVEQEDLCELVEQNVLE